MNAKQDDKALLEAARQGDEAALEQLLSRHEKSVYGFGLRMCGSEEDAKDVLQKTLLAAFRGIRQFRGDAELSTWLCQVARTHCFRARLQLREHLSTLTGEGAVDGRGCPDLAREVALFTQEELDQAACVRLEDHLSRCRNCNQACESLKKSVSLCRRIPGDAGPEPVRNAVRQALSAALSTPLTVE